MRRSNLLLGTTFLFIASAAQAGDFPLKDGDIWVMAGDSITAQHLHSNYFEAFCYARYPKIKFGFRNSGVGGHTIPSTLARFDYDIAAWKPTVISVELGMNDQGGTPTDKFIANMGTMIGRIRGINARPVILSASPINDGNTMAKLGGNQRLHEYAVALKDFAAKEQIPYADQFHALVDIWGKNKPNEATANLIATIIATPLNDNLPGVEHLRAFLAVQKKSPARFVSMQGDAVHPGPTGQLMMAAALLKELGADGFVSSAKVNANDLSSETKGCKVTGVEIGARGLAFDRLDECLPFPIPDEARAVLPLYPTILDLSQYTMSVTGLKDGNYVLTVNGSPLATLSAKELEAGVNLTAFGSDPKAKAPNPITAQGKAILAAVSSRAGLVSQWRGMSKNAIAKDASVQVKEQLAAQTQKVEIADAKIREAAIPRELHFELTPVNAVGQSSSAQPREIDKAPKGFDIRRDNIERGKVETIEYDSKTVGEKRKFVVYTTPGYAKDTKYPVFYLLHGKGGNESSWTRQGAAATILDNLYADKKLVPMIVVMPNGTVAAAGKKDFTSGFENELLKDVIPAVESRYGVLPGPENRALAGLSMGGGQSLRIGLKHLDKFGWIGGFSSAIFGKAAIPGNTTEAAQKIRLVWVSCGDADSLLDANKRFHTSLEEQKIPHIWHLETGGHTFSVWRNDLYLFSQRLFRDKQN